jgi:hypothetical protein
MQFFKRAALLLSGLAASMMSNKPGQAQEASWITFFREDSPTGWIITVDQTTTSGQRGEPKHCARLTYTFSPGQLAKNGFPKVEPSQRYYELEDRICTQLTSIDCKTVATKVGQGKRHVWFCANGDTLTTEAAKQSKQFLEFQTTVSPTAFAELRSLHPTAIEAGIAQDELVLDSLKKNGDIFERQREIRFWFYGVTASTEKSIVDQLEQQGYRIEETAGDKIVFSRVGAIDLREINDETRKLHGLCAELGCNYDGWETAVIRN